MPCHPVLVIVYLNKGYRFAHSDLRVLSPVMAYKSRVVTTLLLLSLFSLNN